MNHFLIGCCRVVFFGKSLRSVENSIWKSAPSTESFVNFNSNSHHQGYNFPMRVFRIPTVSDPFRIVSIIAEMWSDYLNALMLQKLTQRECWIESNWIRKALCYSPSIEQKILIRLHFPAMEEVKMGEKNIWIIHQRQILCCDMSNSSVSRIFHPSHFLRFLSEVSIAHKNINVSEQALESVWVYNKNSYHRFRRFAERFSLAQPCKELEKEIEANG